jgi:hypothetical protein
MNGPDLYGNNKIDGMYGNNEDPERMFKVA